MSILPWHMGFLWPSKWIFWTTNSCNFCPSVCPGDIKSVPADADPHIGSRGNLSGDDYTSQRSPVQNKRGQHVHRGMQTRICWYFSTLLLVKHLKCEQLVLVLFLPVCWVGVVHLHSVWAGPRTCRPEGQKSLRGAEPGTTLQTPSHPPHIQDWQ